MAGVDIKKLRDELLAEQFEDLGPAQEEAADLSSRANWGRVAGNIAGAFGRYRPDHTVYDKMEEQGDKGVASALRKGAMKSAASSEARQIAAAETSAAKDAELDDPNGSMTLAYREFYSKAAPHLDLSKATARQLQQLSPGLNKDIERRHEEAKAKNKRAQDLSDESRKRSYQLEDREANNKAALERAHVMANIRASEKTAEKLQDAAVPGHGIKPGANPTSDDAKKLKAGLTSLKNIESEAGKLEQAYNDGGIALFGPRARRMQQAITGLHLEAKNVAELGALSGPDQELMDRLAALDPTGFKAGIKEVFGQDDTKEALKQFVSWAKDRVGNARETYGYFEESGGQTPARQPTGNTLDLQGGLAPDKKARLEELRRKKAAGALK